jgi:hypothetical protein
MALLSSPFASYGVAGVTTLMPGMCASQDSNDCECCAESWSAAPFGPRKTMGMLNWPPDMYRSLAAEFST